MYVFIGILTDVAIRIIDHLRAGSSFDKMDLRGLPILAHLG